MKKNNHKKNNYKKNELEKLMCEYNKMIQGIEYRDNLLKSVNHAAAFLLNSEADTFEENLYNSMQVMAEAVKVDRVYIWKNHDIDGKLYCSQLYEWSENAEPQQDNEYTVDIAYEEVMLGLEELLSNGKSLNNIVSKMIPKHQEHLVPQGILSIIIVPVFLHGEFWGFVGFDDCSKERIFTKEEESILRSGSLLFAHAYHRNEVIKRISETSQELETALDKANAASRAKGEFLSNMSHEMRTPLNAIIGMATIGKKATAVEDKNHALNKIGDASTHLLGVINDVLDMAKIEANKLNLASSEFSFMEMLHKVLTVINFRADEKQQKITVNVDKSVPQFIIGDEQRLIQVLTNLLSNAVKFTPEKGKIRVNTLLENEKNGVCTLRIEVIDNGIGISTEKQKTLFLPFEQAEKGTSRNYGGTGLGLTISKRIIDLMNGHIWVESEIDKGAAFMFTIEVLCGTGSNDFPDESAAIDDNKRNESETIVDLKGKKLLIAEDVEINCEILIAFLTDTGIEIDCAENGKIAVDMVAENPNKYDIIFMDMQMPKMDGLEATRQIRKKLEKQEKRIPIIAMTANVFKEDVESCINAGMDDHLGKPLDITKIMALLEKYLITG